MVDLDYLLNRLQEVSRGGLVAYVVDSNGRLVAGAERSYAIGQDMTSIELVKSFVDEGGRLAATHEFDIDVKGSKTEMLGTYSPVPALHWAVIAQKKTDEAYSSIYEMQRTARLLAILAVLMSVMISVVAARRITTPLGRADAIQPRHRPGRLQPPRGTEDPHRDRRTRQTFNIMTDEIEHFIDDLKQAAEQNRALFLGLHPDARRRGRRKGSVHARSLRPRHALLGA